jgi:large subunit ribosomal protein L17
MKHGKRLKKLNRTSSHRKSLLINLALSLFRHERIKTTLPKVKALRPFAEKIITSARTGGLSTTRKLASLFSDEQIVKKLMENLSVRFTNRPGGYTRIYKCGFRSGDNAPVAIIELVDYEEKKSAQNTEATSSVAGSSRPK